MPIFLYFVLSLSNLNWTKTRRIHLFSFLLNYFRPENVPCPSNRPVKKYIHVRVVLRTQRTRIID